MRTHKKTFRLADSFGTDAFVKTKQFNMLQVNLLILFTIIFSSQFLAAKQAYGHGDQLDWDNGASNALWYSAGNWNPNQAPTLVSDDIMSIFGSFIIGNGTEDVTLEHGGSININGSPSSFTNVMLGTLTIGRQGESFLTAKEGRLTTDTGRIGGDSFFTGFGYANLSDDARWDITATSISSLLVGEQGDGRLSITDGADVTVSGNGSVGDRDHSRGVIDVAGTGATLNFNGPSSFLTIGASGNGILNVTNSASVSNVDGRIGSSSSAMGTVTVDSNATWSNSGDTVVGSGGTGALNVLGGGVVTAANGTIGDSSSGVGRVLVDGISSKWDIASTLEVGDAGTAQLEIRNGGRVESTFGRIARTTASNGQVTVRGSGSILDTSLSLDIGETGSGTLLITEGGKVESGNAFVAKLAGSTGLFTIQGPGSNWTGSGLTVGSNSANGIVNVTDGASAISTSGDIADGSGSTSIVNVLGGGSQWTNSGGLNVGHMGNGTLNIAGGASVSNTSATVGTNSGSMGVVNVSEGSSQWNNTGALTIGDSSNGSLNIMGGGRVSSTSATVANNLTGTASTVKVDGAGSKWTTNSGSLVLGNNGAGTLDVTNGGTVDVNSSFVLSNAITGTGTATVSGVHSRLDVGSTLNVGAVGIGSLTVSDGGQVDVQAGTTIGTNGTLTVNGGHVNVAQNTNLNGAGDFVLDGGTYSTSGFVRNATGSTFNLLGGTLNINGPFTFLPFPGGLLSLDGTSSPLTVNLSGNNLSSGINDLSVGTTSAATLNIIDGFNLEVANGTTIGANGQVTLTGGKLKSNSLSISSGGLLDFQVGTLELNGGTFSSPGTLNVPVGGTLLGNGNFSDAINGQAGSIIKADGGSLDLGDSSSLLGFVHEGTLDLNSMPVTLHSAGYAHLGPLTMLGGGALMANNGIALGVGDNLIGDGAVVGPIAAGFGSTISGAMTLGDGSSPVGFTSDGILQVGTNLVEIHDLNAADLGTLTTISSGGTLQVNNGAVIDFTDNLTGEGNITSINSLATAIINNGLIEGNSPTNTLVFDGYLKGVGTFKNFTPNGTFAPGLSPALVSVENMTLSSSSTLLMELAGTLPGSQYDVLSIAGSANLAGTLDIDLIDGFDPAIGDTFTILQGGTINNNFTSFSLPVLPGRQWTMSSGLSFYTLGVVAVPEPTAVATFTMGVAALLSSRRRRAQPE